MKRHPERDNCSVARALEILGDAWTMLVIREAFLGTRRFADFEANLGVSKNVLAHRLKYLTKRGVLEQVDVGEHGTRYEYALTPMGKDLTTLMTALRQWGDRWVLGPGHEPLLVIDRRTGRPVPRVRILDEEGEPLRARDIELRPGPGASEKTLARFADALKSSTRIAPR